MSLIVSLFLYYATPHTMASWHDHPWYEQDAQAHMSGEMAGAKNIYCVISTA